MFQMPDTPPWMEEALCAQTDPAVFYSKSARSVRAAKATCSNCPVRSECLEMAIDNQDNYGIWGGLTGIERRELVKTRSKA